MITSMVIVTLIWFGLIVIGNQLLHIRAHAMLGCEFLAHARSVFATEGMEEQADILKHKMIPQVNLVRYRTSVRFFWTIITLTFILMLMITVISNTSIMYINTAAGIGVGYTVMALIIAYRDREFVDIICEACNQDLEKINHYNEIEVVLKNLPKDPPDDTIDG